MELASLIPLIPFVNMLYLVFALVQVLRRQRQGIVAIVLALLVLAAPIIAYFLTSTLATRFSLINSMTISAGIVFVVSIVIGWLDQRHADRKQRSAYGIIGIVVSFVLAIFIVVMPMTQTAAASLPNENTNQGRMAAVSQILTAQTGLSAEELSAQLDGGKTIADLVAAHNGDLTAVITAFVTALDDLKSQGGVASQLLGNMGTDSADIATKLVQGQLPAQAQRLLTSRLVSANEAPTTSGVVPTSTAPTKNNGFQPANTANVEQVQPTSTPIAQPTLAPTETVVRPTPIVFPSATPFVAAEANEVVSATPTDVSAATSAAAVTCSLTIDFNLNLRDQPTTEGSTVLLSIPFGTTVTATGRTAENWYSVSYDGNTGWVSGDYVTAQAACNQLSKVSS